MAGPRSFLGVEGLGLVVGLVLLPIGAAASVGLLHSGSADDKPSQSTIEVVETTSVPVPATEVVVETVMPSTDHDDLVAACGEDGLGLVKAEAEGTITDLQQAALDALRQVCAEAEMPLPGPPAPPPIVRTVTATSPTPAAGQQPATVSGHDDDREDEHEGEHEDQEENEDHGDEHESEH